MKRILYRRNGKALVVSVATHLTLIILVLFINLPILSMVGTAFKSLAEALSTTSLLPAPGHWSFENFDTVLRFSEFPKNLLNTLIVSGSVTIVCITIGSMAGYAISRFHKVRFFRLFATTLLLLQIFPGVLLLLPLFIIFSKLGLTNNLIGLVICYTTMNLAFSIWMMYSFFDTIPVELEEAGLVDGCTQFQTFYRLVLPVSLPGVATIGIFAFINSWNEYTMASILIKKPEFRTMTLGLQQFVQQFSSDWARLMAASTVAIIPTIIGLLFAQKYLEKGMTAGAVKG